MKVTKMNNLTVYNHAEGTLCALRNGKLVDEGWDPQIGPVQTWYKEGCMIKIHAPYEEALHSGEKLLQDALDGKVESVILKQDVLYQDYDRGGDWTDWYNVRPLLATNPKPFSEKSERAFFLCQKVLSAKTSSKNTSDFFIFSIKSYILKTEQKHER